jgi:hypothetical protein
VDYRLMIAFSLYHKSQVISSAFANFKVGDEQVGHRCPAYAIKTNIT